MTRGSSDYKYVLKNGVFASRDDVEDGLKPTFTERQIEVLERCMLASKGVDKPEPSDFGLSSPTYEDFAIRKGPNVRPCVKIAAKCKLNPSPEAVRKCLKETIEWQDKSIRGYNRWTLELTHRRECSVAFSSDQFKMEVRNGNERWTSYDARLRRAIAELFKGPPLDFFYTGEEVPSDDPYDYGFSRGRGQDIFSRPGNSWLTIWFWNDLAALTVQSNIHLDEVKSNIGSLNLTVYPVDEEFYVKMGR